MASAGGGGASCLQQWWKSFRSHAFRTKEEPQGEGDTLVRSLSALDLTMMGVGGSIGAGIFVLTGIAARESGPAVVISFFVAAVVCVLNALCYGELSSRFSVSGSAYLYTALAFGELPGLVIGLNLLFDYHIGAATISRSLSAYFVKMLAGWGLKLPEILADYSVNSIVDISILAPVFLAILTLILVRGVKESNYLNLFLTISKIIIVLLVIFGGASKCEPKNWDPFVPKGIESIFTSTSTVFFSYIGFDVVANAAEEAANPKRDLPIGIVLSLCICAVLYCGTTLVLTGLVPYEDISKDAPLSDALDAAGLAWGVQAINAGAVVGLGTTLLTGMYGQSRLYLSISRDGLLPELLGRVSGSSRVPMAAQVWCGLVAASMATFFDVEELSKILSIGIMASYSVVCCSTLSFRTDHDPSLLKWIGVYSFLVLVVSFGVKFAFPLYATIPAAAVALATWLPMYLRFTYDRGASPGGYRCPLVPAVPLLGLGANIFMAVHLHWAAWVRLFVVSFIAFILQGVRAWNLRHTEGGSSAEAKQPVFYSNLEGGRTAAKAGAAGGLEKRPRGGDVEPHQLAFRMQSDQTIDSAALEVVGGAKHAGSGADDAKFDSPLLQHGGGDDEDVHADDEDVHAESPFTIQRTD